MARPLSPADPSRIGPYDVRAVLGEGGMGVVYRAHQTAPVSRPVALKLIKAGLASHDIVARFQAERQALAVMDHPGIATVYDAGSTADGDPFFAMELVDGPSITAYCDERRLSTRDRIRLFVDVCDAVQHAHQKGVIHRDLKPSNVLIAEGDGTPRPKVIDFGIAKAVDYRPGEETMTRLTVAGTVVGTPAYMSPEQAEGSRLDVDTRADVYSLGVMLYELICGTLPVDPNELGFLPFLQQLLERRTTPPTPSARLAGLNDKAGDLARLRQTDLKRLTGELRGDLDVIVMKALEADRDRRYTTVQELAADLNRFLRHEPIDARPPSRAYLARKFVQRNRGLTVAAAVAVLALVGGATASTLGLMRAVRAEGRARDAQGAAELEAATSRQVSDFLVNLFRRANPNNAAGETVTARQLLEAGVGAIDQNLGDQPVVQGRLLLTMARAYRGLGLWSPAVDLLRRSIAVRERALGPDHPDVAESLSSLASVLELQRGPGDAEVQALTERALAIRRAHRTTNPEAWLAAFGAYGEFLEDSGRREEAERLYAEEARKAEQEGGPEDSMVLEMRDWLAASYLETGRHEEAAALWSDLLARRRSAPKPDLKAIGDLANNLALAYQNLGRIPDAIAAFHEAADAFRAANEDPTKPPPGFGMLLWNLGSLYDEAGRLEEAEATFTEYLRLQERVFGPGDPNVAAALVLLAQVQNKRRAFAAAQLTADRGLTMIIPAAADPRRGGSVSGDLPRLWESYAEALLGQMTVDAAINGIEARAGDDPGAAVEPLYRLTRVLWFDDRPADAASVLRRSLAIREITHGREHRILLSHLARLAAMLEAAGRHEEAAGARARAGEIVRANLAALPADVPVDAWRYVCRWGALAGQAQLALPACTRAVDRAGDDTRWQSWDLRAVARALAGNLSGAAADFTAYVDANQVAPFWLQQRKDWRDALLKGQNPFDARALNDLRFPF